MGWTVPPVKRRKACHGCQECGPSHRGARPPRPPQRLAILGQAAGREITFTTISHRQAVDRLIATGVSKADADYVIGWYAESSPASYTVDPTVEQVLGRPARTFAQWAAEHGHRFG